MLIRDERATDIAAIHRLTEAAFASAPHRSGSEARIIDALRGAGALTLSLVAEEEELLGHVAFSPVRIEGEARGWFGLGPVSVLPGQQNAGIGSALIRAGLARLAEAGAAGCVLVGEPAYYGRFGFLADPALTYEGVPPVYFQRLVLKGPAAAGQVSFHPAFGVA